MKVSKEQTARNRERILDTAAKLFRERGFDGVGVSDLMKEAGLTHGGFYGHFASKEALMAEAAKHAAAKAGALWDAPTASRAAFADYYLSAAHCGAPGHGCAVAALAGDAARQGPAVREAMGDSVRSMAERLTAVTPGRSPEARRARALADYASLVGAVVLARAVDDEALAAEILAAARARLGEEEKA